MCRNTNTDLGTPERTAALEPADRRPSVAGIVLVPLRRTAERVPAAVARTVTAKGCGCGCNGAADACAC